MLTAENKVLFKKNDGVPDESVKNALNIKLIDALNAYCQHHILDSSLLSTGMADGIDTAAFKNMIDSSHCVNLYNRSCKSQLISPVNLALITCSLITNPLA